MTDLDARSALIAYLAEQSPAKWIGRTALMKYCYFLQVLRAVPLGYNFSLYSYGPFDSAVLSDLGDAEALGIIEETPLLTGYGYKIRNLVSEDDLHELAGGFLEEHKADIDWVAQQFGTQSASDLELDSTIIYIDREASEAGVQLPEGLLMQHVRDVKPHFAESEIRRHVLALKQKQLLVALGS
ncbi:MAG TPA: hypothetical protein VEU62_02795 [Bryobacterales bacterium]|nr:hypothetical protein [Bryobacterales bacterium]